MHTCWYTSQRTNMQHQEPSLLTVADWRHALGDGASARGLLLARRARLAAGAAARAAWIHLVDEGELGRRIAELEALAATTADRAALLAAYPLFGVPFAVKDNIDVAGLPTTAACPAWSHVAARSATVVQRLLDAGAVVLGKTNLDQFATGLVGTRSPYGAPASAWADERISGGSSSGSAVVVARGEVPFALGTDTAGSGRVPAGFNHIVGLKPTPGRASTAGVLPACRTLDCVSIFALDLDEAAAVLALIEGPDEADEYSAFVAGPARLPSARPLRVGVPRAPHLDGTIGYRHGWQRALAQLEALGAQPVPLDFEPLHEVAALLYGGPWVAERYAAVQTLLDSRPQDMDPTVAAVIGQARRHSALDTFRAQYRLRRCQRDAERLWSDVDLLMVPTAPGHPTFAQVAADPIGANTALGTYTNFVNLLGWCALALPATRTEAGLPFGVTFIAAAAADAALAHFGRAWQAQVAQPLGATGRAHAAHAAHPGSGAPLAWPAPAVRPTLPVAVVGAHLSGLPLNAQLTERGAVLRERTKTAPVYRLYELPGTQPRKPGLVRSGPGGHAIEVEVWELPQEAVGSFLALVPSPLGLGSIELADGSRVHGFLCESVALAGATEISRHGGWRAWLAAA
jgi:allophanate hydrolase